MTHVEAQNQTCGGTPPDGGTLPGAFIRGGVNIYQYESESDPNTSFPHPYASLRVFNKYRISDADCLPLNFDIG